MTSEETLTPPDNATVAALRSLAALGPATEQNLSVVNIDLVKTNLGERWAGKREQVWSQVEHFLRHHFQPEDLILRLDEVNVLVVQPGRSHLAAQTLAIRAANDLTRFFLGDIPFADVAVHRVDAIEGDRLSCSPVPAAQQRVALMARDSSLWASTAASRMPILIRLERNLTAEVSLAPLLALQSGRAGLGHVVRTVISDTDTGYVITPDERAALQSSDLASADLTVLMSAAARRRTLPVQSSPFIAPVSHHTLGSSAVRYALLQAVRKLTPVERQSLIFEIVDLEPGAPESRIAEVVAIAKPHCRGVICRMDLNLENARKLRLAGATLSIFPGRHGATEAGVLKQTGTLASVLKVIPAVLFHDVTPELLPAVTAAGVTHCTVKPPTANERGTPIGRYALV